MNYEMMCYVAIGAFCLHFLFKIFKRNSEIFENGTEDESKVFNIVKSVMMANNIRIQADSKGNMISIEFEENGVIVEVRPNGKYMDFRDEQYTILIDGVEYSMTSHQKNKIIEMANRKFERIQKGKFNETIKNLEIKVFGNK